MNRKHKLTGIFVCIIFVFLFLITKGWAKDSDPYKKARQQMVLQQIERRGIQDQRVIKAMRKVKRHLFVNKSQRRYAYKDRPVPIGYKQTISQPLIVAYMTEMAQLKEDDIVLEIGTGSGYQAAILAEIVKEVYTIEIIQPLAIKARLLLNDLGYKNVHFKHGDGYQGWPEHAPYDVIIVTAAPKEIPQKLIEQLKIKGRLIIPVGDDFQQLFLITKTEEGTEERKLIPVRFVPLVNPNK